MRTTFGVDVPFRTQQFVVLAAQLGSFHKAARAFGVDHSVVIRSIGSLEKTLGLKLFDRNRTIFTLTKAGHTFIREIQSALDRVQRACDLAQFEERLEQGPLCIGYSPLLHSRLIPVMERIRTGAIPLRPRIEQGIELRTSTMPRLIDDLLLGKLHAVFCEPSGFDEDIWTKPLASEGFSLCVSKNHALARKPDVQIKQLDGERLFMMPRDASPVLYDRTVHYIESTGAQPRICEILSFAHAAEIVSHELGCALLPRSASRLSHTGVLYKPVTDKQPWIESTFCRRRDVNDDRIQVFLDVLLQQLNILRLSS